MREVEILIILRDCSKPIISIHLSHSLSFRSLYFDLSVFLSFSYLYAFLCCLSVFLSICLSFMCLTVMSYSLLSLSLSSLSLSFVSLLTLCRYLSLWLVLDFVFRRGLLFCDFWFRSLMAIGKVNIRFVCLKNVKNFCFEDDVTPVIAENDARSFPDLRFSFVFVVLLFTVLTIHIKS